MSNIDNIVHVTIAIEAPVMDSTSFSNLLLIVQKASTVGTEEMPDVAVIQSAKELTAFGYKTTDEAYIAATVAFNQDPRPDRVYIIARSANADGETVEECLDRAVSKNEWYGFALAFEATATEIEAAAKWAEANEKLFGFSFAAGNCPINMTPYSNTFAIYAGDLVPQPDSLPDGNRYAEVAYMAKCFGYDPGTETWGLKTLNGVTASHLSTTQINELSSANVNYYITVANKDVTQNGRVGADEWIDVIRFRHWLLNKIQIEVFKFMAKNEKAAFNDSGITGIQNVIESVLSAAQRAGGIDEDRYDENENLERGYIVTVPKSAAISAAEKRKRKLTGISFIARLAGAIHEVAIRGTLVY